MAFNFAVVYCFAASIPFVFKTEYGFELQAQGLVFVALIVGYLVSAPNMIVPYMKQMRNEQAQDPSVSALESLDRLSPERLLWPALLGSVGLPISFFWFGWSAQTHVHWVCPVIALALYSWGNNLLYVRWPSKMDIKRRN